MAPKEASKAPPRAAPKAAPIAAPQEAPKEASNEAPKKSRPTISAAPKDLDSLIDAFTTPNGGHLVTVMGMVTDVFLPPIKTKTGDWMLTFTITDPDMAKTQTAQRRGMKARAFSKTKDDLPPVRTRGDVVLLRRWKVYAAHMSDNLLSLEQGRSSWVVFPADNIPASLGEKRDLHRSFKIEHFRHPQGDQYAPSLLEQTTAVILRDKTQKVLSESTNDLGKTLGASETTKQPSRRKKPPVETNFINSLKRMSLPAPLDNEKTKLPMGQNPKFRLIKDTTVNSFCDIVGEAVKIFPGKYDTQEVYVTDYTTNSLLFNYPSPDEEDDGLSRDGDVFGYMPMPKREWPGPYGSMVLKIEVQEPHASIVREKMNEGDICLFQNVRIKMSNQNKMEGNMWRDNKFPDKVLIHRSAYKEDEKVQDVRQRKTLYWDRVNRHRSSKREVPETKGQKKNRKKKEKKAAVLREEAGQFPVQAARQANKDTGFKNHTEVEKRTEVVNRHTKVVSNRAEIINNRATAATSRCKAANKRTDLIDPTSEDFKTYNGIMKKHLATLNKNIACLALEVKPVSLQKLIAESCSITTPSGRKHELPFRNQNVQAFVRVVDFFPERLEDFSERVNVFPENDDEPIDVDYSTQQWKWNFTLLIEDIMPKPGHDKKARLWVHVNHERAEFLLNMDAADLTTNKKTFAQLREKMAILWGNLEERKRAALEKVEPYPPQGLAIGDDDEADPQLSNLPFKCCVQEHGVKLEKDEVASAGLEWDRIFNLFGVTIQ